MKKILFILSISLSVIGCTAPEVTNDTPKSYGDALYCKIIVSLGEDQRGDYIEVKLKGDYKKERYKVNNYQDYRINTEICDFTGLQKQPL